MSGRLNFIKTFSSDLVLDNAALYMLAEHEYVVSNSETVRLLNTPHTHSYCELFACGNGRMILNIGGNTAALQSGDAALVPPLLPHCAVSYADADWASVSFSFSRFQDSGKQDLFSLLYPLASAKTAYLLPNVPELYADMLALNTFLKQNCLHTASVRFAEMIVHTAELCAENTEAVPRGNGSAASHVTDAVTRLNMLNNIINTGFMHRLTARETAAQLFLSERQLSRIIRKQYGTTWNGLLTEKRLSAAKMLLETSDRPPSEIASVVGFGSVAGFYRDFTEKFGVPPAKYRKNKKIQ